MDPRVSAMLRRQADEEMLIAQDRSRAAERTLGNIEAWIKHGFDKGWCGEAVCIQHEGTPFTEIEAAAFDRGDDPCLVVVRINAHLSHD